MGKKYLDNPVPILLGGPIFHGLVFVKGNLNATANNLDSSSSTVCVWPRLRARPSCPVSDLRNVLLGEQETVPMDKLQNLEEEWTLG